VVARATTILQDLVDANPDVEDFQIRLAAALRRQASLSSSPVEILAALHRALPIDEKLAVAKPDDWKLQDSLATTHNEFAVIYDESGRWSEALASIRRALVIWQRAADANPAVTALQNNVGFGLNNLACFGRDR
jgi:hypothetical protein